MALDVDDESEGDTLTQIKMIMSKAVGVYHSLCTAGKWDVNHNNQVSLVVCWNCSEEGHVCGKCNIPKDQAKIDAAHKKWQAVSSPTQADVKTQSKRKKGECTGHK